MGDKKTVVIFGLGGVGGFFGGRLCELAQKDRNLRTIFVVTPKTFTVFNEGKKQLILDTLSGRVVINNPNVIHSAATKELGPVDYVILTTKLYHVPHIIESLKPLVGRDTLIVPLQNGMEITSYLCQALGSERTNNVGCGTCKISSYKVGVGHIKSETETATITFGEKDNKRSERVLTLLKFFNQCPGLVANVPQDIHLDLWEKFIMVVAFSGTGAVTRTSLGNWYAVEESRQLWEQCIVEGINVAKAHGIKMEDSNKNAYFKFIEKLSSNNPNATSSMQRDIMNNQPSEMEDLIGSMVRLGKQKGVHIPTIDFIYAALKPTVLLQSQKSKL